MFIEDLIKAQNTTRYKIAKKANIPHTTLTDICSGKTKLEKCSAETVYKLAKALNTTMEYLVSISISETARIESYEYGLPEYLQNDLDDYKKRIKRT